MTEQNGTGRAKWGAALAATVGCGILLGLVGWNFMAVQNLQISNGQLEYRVESLRRDHETFANEVRTSSSSSTGEMRAAIQRVETILTEVRIRLGGTPQEKGR